MKFNRRLAIAHQFGLLMADGLRESHLALPESIIPVPLHRARLTERGYNQALEIARPIAKILSVPLDFTSCTRVRNTMEQMALPARERRGNVRGAFRVRERLPFRHVAILDDVITTGHTAGELARVIRRAGVKRVDLWACARTIRIPR